MVEKKISLRVYYTINSSPQYILARSLTYVPVTLVPPVQRAGPSSVPLEPQPLYATVLLKTCLDTICRSSPELTHDNSRDWSLYVLDPLESNSAPAPVQISNSNGGSTSLNGNGYSVEQPRGVAVGLGLMSWALTAEDCEGVTVAGTLVQQVNGQEALEVIFALRETMAMKKPTWTSQPASSRNDKSRESSVETPSNSQGSSKLSQSQPGSSQGSFFTSQSSQSYSFSYMQTRSSTTDLTRETLAAIQLRNKPKVKPPKPVRQSTVPVTESDELMIADTYIGPLKKKGRPKISGGTQVNAVASGSGSNSTPREVIVIDGSDSDANASTPSTSTSSSKTKKTSLSNVNGKKRSSQHPTTTPFTTDPLIRRMAQTDPPPPPAPVVKVEPQPELNLLDLITFLSNSSAEPTPENAALLKALSTIDSSNSQPQPDGNAPNPTLVSALKQLLTVCNANGNLAPTPSTPVAPAPSAPVKQEPLPSSHDSTVVVLDKENVNPVPQPKKLEKDLTAIRAIDAPPVAGPSSQPFSQERPVQSLGPSTRSNENISANIVKDVASSSSGERVVRKRTLSDFMDERENGKKKGKGKERERGERRDGHRHASSSKPVKTPVNDSLRHYPRLINQPRIEQPSNYYRMPLESMTSPARPRPEFEGQSAEQPPLAKTLSLSRLPTPEKKPPSPRTARVSASSPVRGPKNENRKKFVLPDWAKTNTSTQPRLSEEAQRALDEAEARKKQERNAARKKQPAVQARLKNRTLEAGKVKPLAPPPPPARADTTRAPITAQSDRPMVAAADISFPFLSSRPSSPSPQPITVPKTPKTPTRDRRISQPTPGRENDSLFTPIMGSGSLFGSAHSSHFRTPLSQSVLTSPLGNRKKCKVSPIRSMLTGKPFSAPRWNSGTSSTPTSSDNKGAEEATSSKSLDFELDDAMEEFPCPTSSLPIASSDADIDETTSMPSRDAETIVGDDTEILPVKQHWAGLPPSSPPAPSSPMLHPEEDPSDDEMNEIPIATSDSETDTDMNNDVTSPPSQMEASQERDIDFSVFLDGHTDFSNSGHVCSSDLFEQFTNLNDQPDAFPSMGDINVDPEMQALLENGLENIDFTEFWATFKPMVDGNTVPPHDQNAGNFFDWNQNGNQSGEVDHNKLAEEMQSLLSGCLM
ncbi:hypothetical protein CPC08DRAFT_705102 [Agrocybe pediades]|nr:hypothetical protein CPC08DRAFT_705102 [Agrocybe pediades]